MKRTKEEGAQKLPTYWGYSPKDSDHDSHAQEEEGSMNPALPFFVRTGSLHVPTFCQMLCDLSVFYHI